MKKFLTIAVMISAIYFVNSCNDENITTNEISLEQKMKTSRISNLDDKLNFNEKKELYRSLFADPQKFGFRRVINDNRFEYFNRKGKTIFLRNLPNEKEENIIISSNSITQKATNYRGYFVFSYSCVCTGIATATDPTNWFADDDCKPQYSDLGIINIDAAGTTYHIYGAIGAPGKTALFGGQWIAMEAGEFWGGQGTYVQDIALSLPDGWIKMFQ